MIVALTDQSSFRNLEHVIKIFKRRGFDKYWNVYAGHKKIVSQ